MKLKAVAFDMDGTLYSSEPIIARVYAESVTEFNRQKNTAYLSPDFSQIEPLIGQPVRKIYETLFPGISQGEMGILGSLIMRGFQKAIETEGGEIFQDAAETLNALWNRGLKVFLASNGKREYLEAISQKFGLRFAPFVCVEEQGIQNKSEILAYYLKTYSLKPQEMLMVGDRESDLTAARNNRCPFAGCHFGHGPLHEIESADVLIDHLSEIPKIIEQF